MLVMTKKKTGLNLPDALIVELESLVSRHGTGRYRIKGAVLAAAILALMEKPDLEAQELIRRAIMANIDGKWAGLIGEAKAIAAAAGPYTKAAGRVLQRGTSEAGNEQDTKPRGGEPGQMSA